MKKLFFVSLGCDKNLVDSENMLGLLAEKGYSIVDDEAAADVIIVNTCSFIHDAKEESVSAILEMTGLKKTGACKALIIAGCMAQLYGQEILDELPEVDAVVGTNSFAELDQVIEKIFSGCRPVVLKPLKGFPKIESSRLLTTGGHYSYLKIAEGCGKSCTYCIIPQLRGKFRSVPMDALLKEASKLAGEGVTELNIIAQETTLYGTDIYGKKCLHELLERLCAVDGLKRIRLLYCYPEEIYPELLETIALQDKICKYLDIPIQHCSDRILKMMGRRTSKKDIVEIIGAIKERIPDIVLRTSLITGFPTETESEHLELLDFIKEMRFDRLGVFAYSREDKTAAAEFDGQVDEKTKETRRDELMLAQQKIAFENNSKRRGTVTEVFTEGYMPDEDIYIGRTEADAPGVDGYIFFKSENKRLESGMYVRCLITGYSDYDLIGEAIDEGNESSQ